MPFLVTMICFGCSSTGRERIRAATSSAVFHLASYRDKKKKKKKIKLNTFDKKKIKKIINLLTKALYFISLPQAMLYF